MILKIKGMVIVYQRSQTTDTNVVKEIFDENGKV